MRCALRRVCRTLRRARPYDDAVTTVPRATAEARALTPPASWSPMASCSRSS